MTAYDILPQEQRDLLPSLRPLLGLGYTLYGGTAIALQLGHRQSIDFDFFNDRPLVESDIRAVSPVLAGARTTQEAPRTLTIAAKPSDAAREVKVSFFGELRTGRVGQPTLTSGGELRLASLDDLLAYKLKVILQRAAVKDYQDIAAILRAGVPLERGLAAARAIVDTFSATEALRALAFFDDGDVVRLSLADRVLLTRSARYVSDVPTIPIASFNLS